MTARQVKLEAEADPVLLPTGRSSIARILSDLSKESLDAGDGERRTRVNQKVRRVGAVGGRSVYTAGDETAGRAFVDLKLIEQEWQDSEAAERREQISRCPLPGVRYGRARLLNVELLDLRSRLNGLPYDKEDDSRAAQLKEHLERLVEAELDLLAADLPVDPPSGVPEIPEQSAEGYITEDLMVLLKGLYPAVDTVDKPSKLVPLLANFVRRIPNPDHTTRFDDDPRKAAEQLFEQTDMLEKAAFRWGGDEARFQAHIARYVLGRLRDGRFVVPALEDRDSEVRLTACLAFLGSAAYLDRLERLAGEDPDPQVQAASAWAHAFVGSPREGLRSDI